MEGKKVHSASAKNSFFAGEIHHLGGLGAIERDGLFHEDVLARIEGADHSFMMRIVRGGDVNDVKIVGGEKVVIISIGPLQLHA